MPAPLEFVTTAVIVTVVDPSSAMVVALLVTFTAAGVGLVVPPVLPVHVLVEVEVEVPVLPPFSAPQPLSPPQPAKASVNPNKAISAASLRMFLT
jgi:hypothetical protein